MEHSAVFSGQSVEGFGKVKGSDGGGKWDWLYLGLTVSGSTVTGNMKR